MLFVFHATFIAVVFFFFAYWSEKDIIGRDDGRTTDLWQFSMTIFNSVFFAVTLKLCVYSRLFNWIYLFFIIVMSVGTYFLYIFLSNYWSATRTYLTIYEIYEFPSTYLVPVLMATFAFVIDLGLTSFKMNIFTTPSDWLRIKIN